MRCSDIQISNHIFYSHNMHEMDNSLPNPLPTRENDAVLAKCQLPTSQELCDVLLAYSQTATGWKPTPLTPRILITLKIANVCTYALVHIDRVHHNYRNGTYRCNYKLAHILSSYQKALHSPNYTTQQALITRASSRLNYPTSVQTP